MTCKDVRRYLSPFLDNELTAKETLEIQSHLEDCPACQRVCDLERAIRFLLQKGLPEETAPPDLWEKIVQRIKVPEAKNPKRLLGPIQVRLSRAWVLAALLLLLVGLPLQSGIGPDPAMVLAIRIVEDHVRTLVAGPALLVRSSDPQAVVQWVKARSPLPIKVPALSGEGPELLGGTFCLIEDQEGVHLVFMDEGRPVSAYAIAALGPQLAGEGSLTLEGREFYVRKVRGYRVVLWREGDLLCAIVGQEETPGAKLLHLALLFAKAPQA